MASLDRQKAAEILAQSALFKDLQPSSLQSMIDGLKLERWPRHKVVLRPREPARRFYVLVEGRVKLSSHNPRTGRALTFSLIGPGGAFGLDSLLGLRWGGVGTETLDDVVALSGPLELWHGWTRSAPPFREAARGYTDRQIHRLVELAGDLALYDTMTRLARLLARHFSGSGENHGAGGCLIRDLPHEELAHMIGSVRVVVSRLLARLKREGVIDARSRELRVLDYEKLLRIANL